MKNQRLFLLILVLLLSISASTFAALPANSFQPVRPLDVQSRGSIHWLSPAGGELAPGMTIPIRWEYSGTAGQQVKIALLKYGKPLQVLSPAVSIGSNGKGLFSWKIPEDIERGACQLEIQSIEQPQVKAISQSFQLRGRIEVLGPNGSEAWLTTEPNSIEFAAAGCGPAVKILLLRNNAEVMTINPSFPLNGSWQYTYTWRAPFLPNNKMYQIKIVSTTYPDIFDVSDSYFTITQKVF